MQGIDAQWLLEKLMLLAPLLASLAVHEAAHARTALAFGDPTARNLGRCSLNPLVHLDPLGTLALLFCGFGWAKPVPVNPHNLHPARWGSIAVSLAGPLSNLLIAFLIALSLRIALMAGVSFQSRFGELLLHVLLYTLAINICLFIFNMLPLYPLDGHHIFRDQLPPDLQARFMRWQMRFGMGVLMLIIVGPSLAGMLGLPVFDPLAWVIDHAVGTAMRFIVLPAT